MKLQSFSISLEPKHHLFLFSPIIGILTGAFYIYSLHQNALIQIILPVIFIGVFIYLSPRIGLFVVTFLIFFVTDWFTGRYFSLLPNSFRWLPGMILSLMFLRVFYVYVIEHEKFQSGIIDIPFIFFFLLFCLSWFINQVSPALALISGFRKAFVFIFIYYIILNYDFSEEYFKKLISILIGIAVIQIPVTLLQAYYWFAGASPDFRGGTLGVNATAQTALWLTGILGILLGFWIHKIASFWHKLFAVLLVIPIFIGMAKAILLYAPLAFIFSFLHGVSKNVFRNLFIGIVVFSLIGAVVYYSPDFLGLGKRSAEYQNLISNPEGFILEENRAAEGGEYQGRFQIIYYTYNLLKREYSLIFGLGPGQGEQSSQKMLQGPYYNPYNDFTRTQISRTLMDYGFAGLLVNYIMILLMYFANRKFFKNIDDPFWKSVSFGFFIMLFLYLTATIYKNVWHQPALAFSFWVFAGMIVKIGKARQIFK